MKRGVRLACGLLDVIIAVLSKGLCVPQNAAERGLLVEVFMQLG